MMCLNKVLNESTFCAWSKYEAWGHYDPIRNPKVNEQNYYARHQ